MIEYSQKYESLIVQWYYQLRSDPVEFENLFDEPVRHLSTFLNYIEHRVKLVFQYDDDGIKYAGWIEPWMKGAFFGFWSRKNERRRVGQVAFIHRVLQRSLQAYPVIIGITRRPELHDVHLALGYERLGDGIPYLFDGKTVFVYVLTQESYDKRRLNHDGRRQGRRRERIRHDEQRADEQPLRAPVGSIREGGVAGLPDASEPNQSSPKHGRRKRANPDHKLKHRRVPRSGLDLNGKHPVGTGESGPER